DRLADIALRVHVGLLRRRRPSHPTPVVANGVVTPRASVGVGGKGLVQPVDRVDEAPAVGGRNRSFVDGFGHLVLQVLKRVARVASMAVAFAVHGFVDRVQDVLGQLVVDRSRVLQLLRQGEERGGGGFGCLRQRNRRGRRWRGGG